MGRGSICGKQLLLAASGHSPQPGANAVSFGLGLKLSPTVWGQEKGRCSPETQGSPGAHTAVRASAAVPCAHLLTEGGVETRPQSECPLPWDEQRCGGRLASLPRYTWPGAGCQVPKFWSFKWPSVPALWGLLGAECLTLLSEPCCA